MADDHRKIELQSPEDLRYLVDTARRAANEKIDRALPQMNGETEDALRARVDELVHEVSPQCPVLSATFSNPRKVHNADLHLDVRQHRDQRPACDTVPSGVRGTRCAARGDRGV